MVATVSFLLDLEQDDPWDELQSWDTRHRRFDAPCSPLPETETKAATFINNELTREEGGVSWKTL